MITPMQRRAMLFIEAELERSGISPTLREIAAGLRARHVGIAHRLVRGLAERGFIRCLPFRARSIVVLRPVSRFAAYRFDDNAKSLERVH